MDILRVFTILSYLSVTLAQMDLSVCKPFSPGTNDPKKPNMTAITTYKVRVEANIVHENSTYLYREYFDYPNRKAATHAVIKGSDGRRTLNIYSFATNELFNIDRDTKNCTVSNLANASFLNTFGRQAGPKQAKIFTTIGALRFAGNIPEKFINRTSVRGIPCNLWRSCVYMSGYNATAVVDWYFSVPGWITTEQIDQVPIRAHVKGMSNYLSRRSFEHFYDFVDFKTRFNDVTVLETPEGVYCPNRKLTKQLPTPTNAFHFTSEVLNMNAHTIGRIKEWYDNNLNLSRYDLTPMGPHYGSRPLTHIHDFNTGVAYIIDQYRGNCTVTNITNTGFDVHNVDPTHVRLRTTKEFYYFDRTQYNYEGTKTVRGILCDVWITRRTDWPSDGPGFPSTWEWYFATPGYTANLPDKLSFGMPVRLEIVLLIASDWTEHYVYNIYDYDEQRPVVWDYDIGKCFNISERRDFRFILPGNFQTLASPNMDDFKYAIFRAVSDTGNGLSSLRINNIQVDYVNNSDITVRFTLLDRPPPIGDVVNPKQEPDLNTVTTLLSTAINNGTFNVTVSPAGKNPVTMTAIPSSPTSTKHIVKNQFITYQNNTITNTSGYSGGVMAGMGVALLVVFFILGILGMYLFYRKQGGAFLPKKFENEDITKDDKS